MHLRSLKKTHKGVSLHDPIGKDKEGNEITLIDILGSEADDVIKEVDLKIEKSGCSGRLRRIWGYRGVMCRGLRRER